MARDKTLDLVEDLDALTEAMLNTTERLLEEIRQVAAADTGPVAVESVVAAGHRELLGISTLLRPQLRHTRGILAGVRILRQAQRRQKDARWKHQAGRGDVA